MKAQILDEEALKAVTPAALAAFARGEGWSRTEAYGAHADVYADDRAARNNPFSHGSSWEYALVSSRFLEAIGRLWTRDLIATSRDSLPPTEMWCAFTPSAATMTARSRLTRVTKVSPKPRHDFGCGLCST